MRVLIVGTTGMLGAALVKAAQKHGHTITALDQRKLQEPGALDVPMVAQDAVICNLEANPAQEPVRLFSEGTDNLIRAMQRHNVRRIHYITAVGVGNSKGRHVTPVRWLTDRPHDRSIREDKDTQERLVSASDRDWLIVRPAKLILGPARARFGVVRNIRGLHASTIPASDVAEWTVTQLKTGQNLYRAVVLTE